jgi:hypothetical protein
MIQVSDTRVVSPDRRHALNAARTLWGIIARVPGHAIAPGLRVTSRASLVTHR